MLQVQHRTETELEAGLETIRQAPRDLGRLEMIVRRPKLDEREVLTEGQLDEQQGLLGDYWHQRSRSKNPDGTLDTGNQLTLINARLIDLLAGVRERWALAGDQLYVDLDLSVDNLPPGSRLRLGSALIEITAKPHTGCSKFAQRYGAQAMRFVNSVTGKQLRLRGVNARVVEAGAIRIGDTARKI